MSSWPHSSGAGVGAWGWLGLTSPAVGAGIISALRGVIAGTGSLMVKALAIDRLVSPLHLSLLAGLQQARRSRLQVVLLGELPQPRGNGGEIVGDRRCHQSATSANSGASCPVQRLTRRRMSAAYSASRSISTAFMPSSWAASP